MPYNGYTSPLRWDKIATEIRRLNELDIMDIEYKSRLTHIYRKKNTVDDGLSIYENAVILNPDKIYYDEQKKKWLPTLDSVMVAKAQLKEYRKEMMKSSGIVLYSIYDRKTNYILYFNIPTLQLFAQVQERIDRILKGIIRNKKAAIDLLKSGKKNRNRLALTQINAIQRKYRDKLKRELGTERRKELEVIAARFDQIHEQNVKEGKKQSTKDIVRKIEEEDAKQEDRKQDFTNPRDRNKKKERKDTTAAGDEREDIE